MRIATSLFGLIVGVTIFTSPAGAENLSLRIARADTMIDPNTERPAVGVMLTGESAQAFARFTQANVGRQIRVIANGKVIASPVIQTPIVGGKLQFSGSLGTKEASDLANSLSADGGTVEVEPVEKKP
ncbi:hypothetical protein AB4037_30805 [Labrys sp. KB_33_2]|uniref:SecDF P1 head subdomain-containing protein n=1 Tax=Labrys sp. KB_33_2 TaxID=3237479 RepID=UPI003F93D245